MDSQLQLEESLLRPMGETVEEEEHEVGLERRKHAQPSKSNLPTLESTVSAEDDHAKINTSSSNISSITTNDEFGHEEKDELLVVNNGGYSNGNRVHHADEAAAVVEEIWGKQHKRFYFEDEYGTISNIEHQTTEYSNGTGKTYETDNGSDELFVSEKDQMDGEGAFNITVQNFETQEALSHHHHHHHHHYHQEGHTEVIDQVDVKENVESVVIEEIDFEEIDVEETDYNVEEVIEKQNTHDLVCPHCSSCITRSVILRRRPKLKKRIKRTRKTKPTVTPTAEVIAPVPEATANLDIENRDPEAFRCLSCFSLFIRIGTSIFSRTRTEEMQTSQEITTSETTSIVTGQVLDQKQIQEDIATSSPIMVNSVKDTSSIVTREYDAVANSVKDTSSIVTREYDAVASVTEVTGSTTVTVTVGQTETLIDHSNGKIVEDAVEPPNFAINSIHPVNALNSEEMKINLSKKAEYTNGNGTENHVLSWQQLQSSLTQQQKFIDTLRVSKQIEAEEVKIDIEKKTENTVEKEKAEDSSSVVIAPPPDVAPITEEQQPVFVQEPSNDFDVLKSIVYGGLIESITSLGVVSSAVGAGASTLNIFVLALANLIGGLFILAHNLKELKKETDETTTQTGTEDNRYFKLLGRRGRFPIHATVVVISYIIFGLVAPITYGFSFHVSNDKDYKLASVAAASLFCVLVLSLAKAHVKNPPRSYIKTVLEYLSIGVATSGISFLAGELLDKIMEQLGWLDSTSSVSATTMTGELGWTSY